MSEIDPIYEAIGFRVRDLRQDWRISQNALATRTHLPIGRIEMGMEPITIPALYTIARALYCSVYTLLPEKEEQP